MSLMQVGMFKEDAMSVEFNKDYIIMAEYDLKNCQVLDIIYKLLLKD